jgi:two-component system CheB/CheR fusion protein
MATSSLSDHELQALPSKEAGQSWPRIVAIGASAGGLEAIQEFFDNIPNDSGLAFVVIQHLSPDHKSLLTELVARHTEMHVLEAEEGMPVTPDSVYIIPTRKTLTVAKGHLRLAEKRVNKSPNMAIDAFFHSLAADDGERSVAIILSGTGTDGSKGAEAIKNAGGYVLAQDPATAKFDGMPNSVINTGCADEILAPELMPEALFNHLKLQPTKKGSQPAVDPEQLETIFALVNRYTSCDFHQYKRPTILRRIARRMVDGGFRTIADYVERLKTDPEECTALCADFLIGVTRFFRDKAAFEILRNDVFPYIERTKTEHDTIKVWIPACSTGEEAYTIAILLNEQLLLSRRNLNFKIFGTDLDEKALQVASKGLYPLSALQDMEGDLVDRYFIRQGDFALVSPELRRNIVFAKHNLIKDPPFIKNDFVSCRNLLIYFNETLQKKTLTNLVFSLNTGGYLFMGPSETVGSVRHDLEEINGKWKIYAKVSKSSPRATETNPRSTGNTSSPGIRLTWPKTSGPNLLEAMKDVLAEDYGIAALFLDRSYEVREATGEFRRFLTLPEKTFGFNVLKMVPPDLSIALGTLLRAAIKSGKKERLENIKVRDEGKVRSLIATVKLQEKGERILVVLEERKPGETSDTPIVFHTVSDNEHLLELEAELKETKLSLQTAVEELETTNEELQSSNEELLSANEELQSSNEELQSLNGEHQSKIKELQQLNDDLNNYFSSVDIAQVFLDEELRIRRFNPSAVELINLIGTDIGRPISHISDNLLNDALQSGLASVLRNNTIDEKEVDLRNGSTYQMRISPYKRSDGKRDGLVVSFYDITSTKKLTTIISGIFEASQNAIMALHAVRNANGIIADFTWVAVNEAASKIYGRPVSQLLGARLRELYPKVVEKGLFQNYVAAVEENRTVHFEYPYQCPDGVGWFEVVAVKMGDGIAATFTDITDKKNAEERLRSNYNQLVLAREELRHLNSSLEATVARRTEELTESEERLRLVAKATNDAVYDWDLTSGTEWWSEGLETQFGHKASDAIINPGFWEDSIHPEDQKAIQQSLQRAVNSGIGHWAAEYRFKRLDGSYAYVLDRASILHDENGVPYRMLGSMLDVTAVRNARLEADRKETEYLGLADAMPHIVWAARPDGVIDFYNKRWYDFTGAELPGSEAADGWMSLIHPADEQFVLSKWQSSVETGEPFEVEFRIKEGATGNYRWFVSRAKANFDSEGNLIRWHGVCLDIHDRKTAADELEKRVAARTAELRSVNEELERSNHDLQQFASVTSHDLKEPLRKIQVFGKMLRDKAVKEDQKVYADPLNRIVHSSERMTALIDDLLSFSRLSAALPEEPTDLNDLVSGILSDLEILITEKKAEVIVPDLPVINAVPGQLRQLFQNLISNALKFAKPDVPPRVSMTSSEVAARDFEAPAATGGAFVRIEVADNGIGFDDTYRDKIFTLFQRLHTRDAYEGTGIGLAICKKIVEKHGGIITAKSTEGEGSTFIMILPKAGANKDAVEN